MKNILRIIPTILLSLLVLVNISRAEQYHFKSSGVKSVVQATAAGCALGANFKWLEINNVRTRINTGGDMWWDFEVAQYEVPKGSKKMSMFSAALWIGGLDANGQLKLAAQKYRQGPSNGTAGTCADFFPGPLTIDGTASITPDQCAKYDKLHYITRAEVDNFLAWYNDKPGHPDYQIPTSISTYPAHGDESKGQSFYLAPFYDNDPDGPGPIEPDGIYNPLDGDYPYYDLTNSLCHTKTLTAEDIYYSKEQTGNLVDQVLKGDATLWWVFNDKGNIHTETKGEPIGLEIRAQAFGFSTNDEINNMTFYSYEIINRSTYRLTQTYFSQWVDTDLGYAGDDFVGCDVTRGLGYCYNGKAIDGNGQPFAYGDKPPAIGVDFFQGPYIDHDKHGKFNGDNPGLKGDTSYFLKGYPDQRFTGGAQLVAWDGDTIEKLTNGDTVFKVINSAAVNGVNFGNGIEDDERYGMRRFVYHNNSGVPAYMTDPSKDIEYYNYLKGIWKDGTKMIYGGLGHEGPGANVPPLECDFMFPGMTDIYDWGTKGVVPNPKDWTEVTAGNPPSDRRFMESAGPFILEPGAVNYITVGIPWAQAQSGGPQASVVLLQQVDDKCQMLFDNCFKVISGPNAPDLTIREMDKELILYISNRKTNDAGNNFQEKYSEYDPRIQGPAGSHWDSLYHFEGYQIYQLINSTVSVADLKNTDMARLVFQCDVKNSISQLVNFYYDQNLNGSVPVEEVLGADKGITHAVRMNKDAFTGENLMNHKQYYYLAVAYAQNNYKQYKQNDPDFLNGQKLPYLAGRKNIKTYTGIPHTSVGLVSAQSSYGDGLIVTRLAGQGNGGRFLELSDESVAEILAKPMADTLNVSGSDNYPIAYNLTYKKDQGPLDVKVIDPLNVKDGNYTVKFDSMYIVKTAVGSQDTDLLVSSWSLTDNATGKIYKSDTAINMQNEQLFLDLGLSVTIEQTLYPGPYVIGYNFKQGTPPAQDEYLPVYGPALANNGFLGATIAQDSAHLWLNFLPDRDGVPLLDWIKAGKEPTDWQSTDKEFDPEGVYETVLGGTWCPYIYAQCNDTIFGVAHYETPAGAFQSKTRNYTSDLASIDVVFTNDRSKWTRSAVIEESSKQADAEGKAKRHDLRKGRSVNQNGDTAVVSSDPALNSDFIAPYGMGWFPGYAINIETGERLNIIFGEDSRLIDDNGRDMKFNPSSRIVLPSGKTIMGGRHYIYVMAHTVGKKKLDHDNKIFDSDVYDNPAYDGCAHFFKTLNATYPAPIVPNRNIMKALQFSNCMWTAIPLAMQNSTTEWLANDVKIELRITKPYNRYFSIPLDGAKNDNGYWPMYSFGTQGVATDTNDVVKAKTDLDLINVVPNPYNAYSEYETNQLDNRVKIVNLPQKCTVTIYSTNGNIIRQYKKDETKTYIDWDLKNFAGIPIAGGVYIIHVKSDQGEKVIKWFGSLRPVDLNAF